jgi:hypothetical protein
MVEAFAWQTVVTVSPLPARAFGPAFTLSQYWRKPFT